MNIKSNDWRDFISVCLDVKSQEDLELILNLMFTYEEKENISSRYLIIKELLSNKLTQREICKQHKVSIAQITRGSNALKQLDENGLTTLKNLIFDHHPPKEE